MLATNNVKMTWPHSVVSQFEAVNPNTTVETKWYAPYNTLLTHVFKSEDGFGVAPQYSLYESRESIDFTTIYIVQRNRHLVFILEIKPHPNLVNISRRIGTDVQIRQCFNKLQHHIVIPRLHAVSTMGTTFATYKLDKPSKRVTPAKILSTEDTIQDLVPQSWWKHEILELAGEAIFLEIVKDVKVMSFNI